MHLTDRFRFFLVGLSCVSAWWPGWDSEWLRPRLGEEFPWLSSAGGLKASASPVTVSGVGSVLEMAATWPGVSAKPGSDSLRSDRTELSDSEPSRLAVRT